MNKLITITTDFGDQLAPAQLKAVIATLGYTGRVIENHGVTAFSITEGAFEINLIARFSPIDSVHVGVVDPKVGSDRKGIIIKTKKSWLVGPDNGLLYITALEEGIESVWQLIEYQFGDDISNTFHGRDVFIKAAVYLSQSKKPEEFGSIKIDPSSIEQLNFKIGEVLHIDYYGNIKVFWPNNISGINSLTFEIGTKSYQVPIVKTFSDVEPGKPLALLGSSKTLELAVNLGRGNDFFGIKLGDVLKIKEE